MPVVSFLRRLLKVSSKDYKLRALVSARTLEPMSYFDRSVHVFCDLDKTYLETEFESWIKMAKIPFESPHDKITVPGASEVLELVRWGGGSKVGDGPRAGLHFVSSSPPQLRLALDGKLTLDRLEWSSDTFKNQTYNLRMGRLDLLRHHIAYKTKAILDIALNLTPESRIVMIGDNAEYDPFIYTGVRLLLEKRFDLDNLRQWLTGAMVELPVIEQVLSNDLRVPDGLRVEGVYIRSVPSYSAQIDSRFDGTWYEFDHWAQVAWSLMKKGIITAEVLPQLLRSFHNHHGVPLAHLRWCIYRALEKDIHANELRSFAEQSLLELANLGASGPTRRMLGWEFDVESANTLDSISLVDPREDANQWYRSIAAARLDRKKQQR
jgi:hypothetical protein